jgi:hypothetical protein
MGGGAVKIYADVHGNKKSGDGFGKQHRNTSTYREMGKEILLRFWRMYRKDALGRLSIPAQDKTRRPV